MDDSLAVFVQQSLNRGPSLNGTERFALAVNGRTEYVTLTSLLAYVIAHGGGGGGGGPTTQTLPAGRAFGTIYQNTHASVLWVSCNPVALNNFATNFAALTGPVSPPVDTVINTFQNIGESGQAQPPLFFPVLPSWYYRVTQSSGNSAVLLWAEWY